MHDYLPIVEQETFYTCASGGLGHGLPAAIGVAMGRPGAKVIAILGDGSSMYSIQGLWSAAQNALPIAFVIVKNGTLRGAQRVRPSFPHVAAARNPAAAARLLRTGTQSGRASGERDERRAARRCIARSVQLGRADARRGRSGAERHEHQSADRQQGCECRRGATFERINPLTGEIATRAAAASVADAHAAADAAHAAFASWSDTGPTQRGRCCCVPRKSCSERAPLFIGNDAERNRRDTALSGIQHNAGSEHAAGSSGVDDACMRPGYSIGSPVS